ncbi:MAG: YciI family protein [Propioniciclava sp.]
MKYMLLLASGSEGPQPGSPEEAAEMGEWFAYDELLKEAGVFVEGEALMPVDTATTVRVRDGKTLVTDGPFAEAKEVIGGYYVLEVPDLDAAIEYAAKAPNAGYGSNELRPVVDFEAMPG